MADRVRAIADRRGSKLRRARRAAVGAASGLLALLPAGQAAGNAPCRPATHLGHAYTVCTFDVRETDLRLFWRAPDGRPFASFGALADYLAAHGETLAFAMNAGMYHPDLSPVGLYVEDGRELKPASTADGPGNFHLKPNGVFFIGRERAGVLETGRFSRERPNATIATQSGPMLVIDGELHPRFLKDSTSAKRRNGVGVKDAHTIVFAISEGRVTFHDFASFFRDALGCGNALYLDGSISSLYAPSLGRADRHVPLGPIVGAVKGRRR